MNTSKNPFEEMMRAAQDMAQAMNPALETFSPKGFEAMMPKMPKDMMEMVFGNTFNTEGLDAKTRLLLTLAGLTMQGAQNDEIIETIGQMSMFAGLPAMTRAMQLAQEVMEDKEDTEK
ncbi:MAG: carboxymuconolactone decarboxylase family protein [Rhodobacteraceae bacterium]|nr:carboxymuconolactone decarboxylase family protein [Paracoccaceae bacterium]